MQLGQGATMNWWLLLTSILQTLFWRCSRGLYTCLKSRDLIKIDIIVYEFNNYEMVRKYIERSRDESTRRPSYILCKIIGR